MQLKAATDFILTNLRTYLAEVDEVTYRQPIEALSNSTLGQHTRHTLDFFHCIAAQSTTGVLSYDDRVRDPKVEESPKAALESLDRISNWFHTSYSDKHLLLRTSMSEGGTDTMLISSSLNREWSFAVEHAIHHMAIIRIGAKFVKPGVQLPEHFGLSPSTIKYRNQKCAQ